VTQEPDLQRMEEDRMTRALEQAPAVAVPADFAARLMVAAAASNRGSVAWEMAEWIALAQLGGIALWRGLAWRRA
jgi:hypothetical protein